MKTNFHIAALICCTISFNYSFAQNWSLIGNGGTVPGTNFLGTTDKTALVFKTFSGERMRIALDGKIGVGTATPAELLHLSGGTMRIDNIGPSFIKLNSLGLGNVTMEFLQSGVKRTVLGFDNSTNDFVIATDKANAIRPDFIINATNGFVGLNTKIPSERLHVLGNQILDGNLTMASTLGKGNINFTSSSQSIQFANPGGTINPMMFMFSSSSSNPNRMVLAHSPAFPNWGLQYVDANDQFNFLSAGSPVMSIGLASKLIGIGTSSPNAKVSINSEAGQTPLSVTANGISKLFVDAVGGVRIGSGIFLTPPPPNGLVVVGNTGIGTSLPEGNLHVYRGNAGTVTANANAPLIVENSANNYINLLAPSANERGILFGDNLNASDGGIIYVGSLNSMHFRTNGNITRMYIDANGNMVIGNSSVTPATGYKLSVDGKVMCEELRVELSPWADYVFEKDYKLKSLNEVEKFVSVNKHLPGIPSAREVATNGLNVGKTQSLMMEKIEELTLYIIELNKQIEELKKQSK